MNLLPPPYKNVESCPISEVLQLQQMDNLDEIIRLNFSISVLILIFQLYTCKP